MSHKTRPLRSLYRTVAIAALFCFLFAVRGLAQNVPIAPGQVPPSPVDTELEAQQKRTAEKMGNAKRQKEIKQDTDKLLALATELKQYVDKSDENTLSVAVIKKAEEIEKLAHTVKEKMKGP